MAQVEGTKDISVSPRRSANRFPRLQGELEQIFDGRWPSLFDWGQFSTLRDARSPKVDVIDRESEIVVKAELPGFSRDNIDVSVTDNTVSIRAAMQEESAQEEDDDYYLREVTRQSLSRTLRLPADVDAEQASARCSDGVLEVRVPKIAQAKRRHIEIES